MGKETNFPYAGTPERYQKWEKEPVKLINVLEYTKKELGYHLPESLQKVEKAELTPEQAVDIDNRALQNPDCPNIVFGRPHAGEYVPQSLLDKMDRKAYGTLAMIDRGTEEIFKSEKILSVGTKISRLFVDPNRPPLMNMKVSNPRAVGKVFWYKGIYGENMYQEGKEPKNEEIEDLVERFYLPYYNGMMGSIGTLTDQRKSKNERVLVVDGHSAMVNAEFDFLWENYEIEDPKELPLFIIGDTLKDDDDKEIGFTCDKDIVDAFKEALEENFKSLPEGVQEALLAKSKSKKIVGVNEYLKGVHNVKFYGQRNEGVNSMQVELNEGMYVDDKNDNYYNSSYNYDKMKIVKGLIEKTCLDINPILKNKK